jgi:alpha-2-macroglobulin
MPHRAAALRSALFALICLSLFSAALVACAARPPALADPEVNMPGVRAVASPTPVPGLQFTLSAGSDQGGATEVLPPVPGQPLSAADTARLLDRLPPLQGQAGDTLELNLPKETLPPPRPGETIKQTFPPPPAPVAAPEVTAGPLEVLRYAPEGDVPLAPNLNVTFNQPMVALTGLSDLAQGEVPVKLSPQPEGQWRWVGTKTLVFEPAAKRGFAAGRFPAATRYTVEIPAGAKSASGNALAHAVTFTFTTPAAQVERFVPSQGPTRRDTPMFAEFNQRIDPAAVLKAITITSGGRTFPVTLVSEVAAKDDLVLSSLVANAQAGRWLAFRATELLPADAQVDVTFGPGVPSAEGPLLSEKAQSYSFRTYGPLRILRAECGWGGECQPFMPWQVEFTNPLERSTVTTDTVKVEPPLSAMAIDVYGNTVQIRGASAGRTTYKITFSASIADTFGQTLGRDETVTIAVGSAQPAMNVPGGNFVVLDPFATPGLSVYTINYTRLNVRAHAVTAEDWPAFKNYIRERYRTDAPPAIPGKQVWQKTVNVESAADKLAETFIDLEEAYRAAQGHLVVLVKPERTGLPSLFGRGGQPEEAVIWTQRTNIGLDAFADAGQLLAWANDLKTGAPLSGVELSLWPGSQVARTSDDGTATLPLPAGRPAQLLVARANGETAFLPADVYYWADSGWQQRPLVDQLRWYVFDDRQMYRPGEEVHVKGWVRRMGAGPRGDLGLLQGAEAVQYRLNDAAGNEVASGRADINASGGFDFAFKLLDTMNLGPAYIQLDAIGGGNIDMRSFGHQIQVQEFRRPEFEVKTTPSEGPYFVGDSAHVEVSANYYAGGPLPNADVTWQVTSRPGTYSPPGWDDFTFGRWVPWWYMWSEWSRGGEPVIEAGKTFTGTTDAAGLHRVRIGFDAVVPPEPSSVTAQATVMDVNRQAWSASSTLLVHPANLYVGLRTERLFVEKDEPLPVDIIVTDLDGNAVPGVEVRLRAARLEWKYLGDTWAEDEVASEPCRIQSAAQPVRCTFKTPEGGTYRIISEITDSLERKNQTELTRWVSGGKRPVSREVEQEEATLIPNQKEYQPGDTAEILVQSPFFPAEGLLTLRRAGLVRTERFTMDGPSTTLRIPIEEGYIPNLHVQVDLVGAAERTGDAAAGAAAGQTLPRRPAYATGTLNLTVPPLSRTLSVDVAPAVDRLEPGGTTEVDVTVVDANGQPVANAELAVAVVDESVLALTGYDLPDPLTSFYGERSPDVSDHHNRGYIVLASPESLQTERMALDSAKEMETAAGAAPAAAPMATATMNAGQPQAAEDFAANADQTPVTVRTDFNALAHWAPSVPTDASGKARLTVKLPDNLTRYRVMVVAVAGGKQFGKGQSAVTARLPLMVRPSAPRFLNFGDQFELPVVVQNQTDAPMTVDVAVRATNALLTDGEGRRVTVPANDRVEVRFPTTTVSAGTARFQFAAVSGKWADAATVSLPVWTPATTEAFAVYGTLDQGSVAQPVIAPTGVYTQFGGLEISTSSTALQALTDAFLYLIEYPFECSEQISSRILAVAALRDVLTAFKAAGLPPASEIEFAMARDIEMLRTLQNGDGGWPVWVRGDPSWPYHSIHTAHALQRAKLKGYDVPGDVLAQGLGYLRNIEQHYPYWYSEHTRTR